MAIEQVNGHAWCNVCKKFTKADGTHDCDPNWRANLQRARAAAGANGNRKRRWRATPKRLEKLRELCKLAALGKAASKKNFKREKVKAESLAKMSKALARSLGL